MRGCRFLVGATALVMVLAACGDDAQPVRYTAAQLDGALLAPADVGADFSVDDRTGGESRPPDTPATEWSIDDGGTASMAALSAGDAGDDSAAALVTYLTEGPDAGYAWRNRVGVVRVGTTVIVLQELDVQQEGSPAYLTDAEWQAVVATAVSRVESLSGG